MSRIKRFIIGSYHKGVLMTIIYVIRTFGGMLIFVNTAPVVALQATIPSNAVSAVIP